MAEGATQERWLETRPGVVRPASLRWYVLVSGVMAADHSYPEPFVGDVAHIATFDPPTVLGLIEEIGRLRGHVDVLIDIAYPFPDSPEGQGATE